MPTTRKQKNARKSGGIDMLSDIENLDIMLGENHFNRSERDESVNSNCARRQENTIEDEFENNGENRQLDSRDVGSKPMPIMVKIHLKVFPVQRSLNCQVS